LKIQFSGITDVGLKREGNEDSFSTDDSLGLYIVADGMGGHLAGEVASRVAVEIINKTFKKWVEEQATENEIYGEPDSSLSLKGNYLLGSIRLANKIVHEMAVEQEEYHGMGTTVVMLLVSSSRLITANVGDSRLYLIRNGEIEALSNDHSIVAEQIAMGMMTEEEAAVSPLRHVLTRNLGSSGDVVPDIFEIVPEENDRLILCSDGLTDLVPNNELLQVAENIDNPENLCRKLVDTVLDRGAHDNTTIISVFISGMEKKGDDFLKKLGMFLIDLFFRGVNNLKKILP